MIDINFQFANVTCHCDRIYDRRDHHHDARRYVYRKFDPAGAANDTCATYSCLTCLIITMLAHICL